MANKKESAERKSITVNVGFRGQTKGQEVPQARVYLFDRAGRFLDSKPVDGKPLTFRVDDDPTYQLRVGPDLLKDQKAVPTDLVAQLNKAKAISQDYIRAIHGESVRSGHGLPRRQLHHHYHRRLLHRHLHRPGVGRLW